MHKQVSIISREQVCKTQTSKILTASVQTTRALLMILILLMPMGCWKVTWVMHKQ